MAISRAHYRERQLLTTDDLASEQAYLIDLRRRHNIGPHDWGIVEGLLVTGDPFFVSPGFAIDGYGRELILARKTALPTRDEIAKSLEVGSLLGHQVDIWLLYGRDALQVTQTGRFDCGAGKEGSWIESIRFGATLVEQGDISDPDPRFAPGVPVPPSSNQLPPTTGPHIAPPDDPEMEWPVHLCRIKADGSIDLSNRPLVLLRGQSISAPSGRARMQVDNEAAGDRVRFGVFIADATGTLQPQWTVDRRCNTTIQGETGFGAETAADGTPGDVSDLSIGPDVEPILPQPLTPSGLVFGPLPAPKDAASPWHVYCDPEVKAPPEKIAPADLRFEFAAPAGKGQQPQYGLSIGKWSDKDSKWSPCLQVTDDCTVGIAGDLKANGNISVGPIDADPFDPRFQAALLNYYVRGLLGSQTAITSDLKVELTVPAGPVQPGTTQNYSGTVKNNSPTTPNRVSKVEIFGKVGSDESKSLKKNITLDTGQSETYNGSFTVPAMVGTLNVQIDVVGRGMAGQGVKAEPKIGSVQVQFTPTFSMTWVGGTPPSVPRNAPVNYTFRIVNTNSIDLTNLTIVVSVKDSGPAKTKTFTNVDIDVNDHYDATGSTEAVTGASGAFVTFDVKITVPAPGTAQDVSLSQIKVQIA